MRDTPSPTKPPGLHPDDSRCSFWNATGNHALNAASAKVSQGVIYHQDDTRCPMFTITRSGSQSPTDSDSSTSGFLGIATTEGIFHNQGSDPETVDTDVEQESVFNNFTARNVDKHWIYDALWPFIQTAYGPQTLLDSIKNKQSSILA